MSNALSPSAVLCDLDGTLADTAPDLAYALNRTLARFGRPQLPFERIRPVVSHGGIALIRDCHATMHCRSAASYPGGDHVILVGEVESMTTSAGSLPLLFHRGQYRKLDRG